MAPLNRDWDSVGRSDIMEDTESGERGQEIQVAAIDIDLLKFAEDDLSENGESRTSEETSAQSDEIALDDLKTVATVTGRKVNGQVDIEIMYHSNEQWILDDEDIHSQVEVACQEIERHLNGTMIQ